MKYFITVLITLMFTTLPTSIMAKGRHHGGLHKCLKAASSIKEGYYAKLEYLIMTDGEVETYEIEIKDKDGVEWELMCNIKTGNIYELEREVDSPSDPLFKKNMKVSEEEAGKTANALYPGKIVHTEYEIESNGDASYEFDIYERPGVTYKVEVDATTGKIKEVNIEKWDIGREADE